MNELALHYYSYYICNILIHCNNILAFVILHCNNIIHVVLASYCGRFLNASVGYVIFVTVPSTQRACRTKRAQDSIAAMGTSKYNRHDYCRGDSGSKKKMDMKGKGYLLSGDVKLFRLKPKAVQLMYKANVSVNSLVSVAEQLESWAGVTMGSRRAL
jgi:hypothetical protein